MLVLALAWWFMARPVADLGLVLPTTAGWIYGSVALLLLIGVLGYSLVRVKAMSDDEKHLQQASLGDVAQMLPRTDRELRASLWLSLTAGVVEEIVYRGFVLWVFSLYMPLWVAVVVSSVLFGIGHIYQSLDGVVKTAVIGLVLGLLYVATGSLLFPILVHIVLDGLQMVTVRQLFLTRSPSPDPA